MFVSLHKHDIHILQFSSEKMKYFYPKQKQKQIFFERGSSQSTIIYHYIFLYR